MFHPQSKNNPYFRKALYTVYGGKCAYCGDPIVAPGNLHVDHVYAENARATADPELQAYLAELRAGGFPVDQPDVIENYLPACQKCNRQKSNRNFNAQNLRFYHNLALNHTSDILKKLDQYRGKKPVDLDDFRVENMAIRCLTALPPRADTSNVICRERELADVRKLLREGKDVLLMSGFGGIGKTSLARLVFYTVLDEYDEVAWVPYRGSLRDSMIGTFLLPETYRTPDDRWARILKYSRDGLKKLIVVDNADHIGRQDPQTDPALEALSRWPDTAVIVTSRLDELGPYQKKEIGFLSPEACVELFYLYYPNDPERVQHAVVEKLVELAQYHSLTVELFAKGAKRKADLESYYQTLSKDLRAATRQFATGHTGKMGTIEAHLRGLFIVQDRTDAEKHTLWSFAVLPPNAALSVEEAEKWFGLAESELDPLAEDGWLLWKDDRYAMHPLVRQIIRLNEMPAGTAQHFLDYIENRENGFLPDDEVYSELTRRLELANAVLNTVCKDGDTIQEANILHNLGWTFRQLARYAEAVDYYNKALIIKEIKFGKEHPGTANTFNGLALVFHDMGNLPKALKYTERVLAIYEAKLGKEHPLTARTYNNLASVYQTMGNLSKALEYFEKALAIEETKLGVQPPSTSVTYNNLATLYRAMGNLPKALEYHVKALAIHEARLGKEHPLTATTYNNMALIYLDMGSLPRALEYYKRAMPICENKLGKEHPSTAAIYNNLANVYRAMGNLPKALEYFEKVVPIVENKLGKEHPDTATTYNNLANVYKDMGDLPRALEYIEKAMAIKEKVLGKEHPDTATTYNNLALVYKAMGDLPRALEYFEKALAIRENVLGKEHPDTATTYNNLGVLYYEMKRYSEAEEVLLRSLRVRLVKLGPGHSRTKDTYYWLSGTYQTLHGETDSFLSWLRGQLNAEENRALDELLGA